MEILVLLLAVLVVAAGWYVSVRVYPFAPCRVCSGSGKMPGSNRDRWGGCRRCGGSGKRLRLGARKP